MPARATLALSALLLAAPAHADPRGNWGRASDIGRTSLGVAASAVPAIAEDWREVKQSLLAMGSASLVTGVLKRVTHERRPDGSDRRSFPSGHTSLSFAAAASLDQRFGLKAGLPAHLIAGMVGLARVKADRHFWHDVVVGAVVGEVAGRVMVDHRHGRRASPPLTMSMQFAF